MCEALTAHVRVRTRNQT